MRNATQPLEPWGPEKKIKWLNEQTVKRTYQEDVLNRVTALSKTNKFTVDPYGSLSVNPERFPLYAFRIGNKTKPNILITGGVHGYETSGVKGALLFLEETVSKYTDHFNFVVAPCISPWSYETINRLDPIMENPNREFKPEGKAEESLLLMKYLTSLNIEFDGHIDLHETTDSDKQFLPEEYSKNGLHLDAKDVGIPDGFYLIGCKGFVRAELEKAMMDAVRKVTHIAEPDEEGKITGTLPSQEGVIHESIPGLCAEFTAAKSRLGAFTTEMYPDSEKFKGLSVDEVEATCCRAQVACIEGALNFWEKLTH